METIFRKVSVKERLPQKDGDYFVYVKDEDDGREMESAIHFSAVFNNDANKDWENENVIYWLEEIKQ